MTDTSIMSGTYSACPAGLVSVDGRSYPLKSACIMGRAEGGIAATTLTQTYDNPYAEPLEVLYTLPLPASGAVIGYAIRLGQRIIRGEVRRREEAQEQYRKALFEGRTAALLEQDRPDTFTQKLGCLPPGETVAVEIEVLQPLMFLAAGRNEAARWEYRFPTVVGVRYEGGPGRVRDAGKLDVDRADGTGTPVRLEASLLLADGPAGTIHPQVPGQEIGLEDVDGGARVVLREHMKLDRDLVIRWTATQSEVGVRLVEGRGLPCDGGRYVLLTLTPPAAVHKGLARDLTILLDASGSMSGKPLERAKIVAEELLQSLDPGDRFEILAFASTVQHVVPRPTEASEKNIAAALKALSRIDADGSTEMTRAMVEALAPLRRDSQRQVILISDGYIGFEHEVIGEVMRRLAPGSRLHAVGIGAAPNRTLTRGVARAGRGVEILVGDGDDARAASRHLLQATVRPVLTDVELKGTALVSVAPSRPQDVLEGHPLLLFAEVAPAGGTVEIRARLAGQSRAWVRELTIPKVPQDGSAIPGSSALPLGALFGREAIADVELHLAAAGGGSDVGAFEAEIERLGLKHGIASRKTSLVAISEDPTVDPRDPRRRERLAVELPAEVSAEGAGLAVQGISRFATPHLFSRAFPHMLARHGFLMEDSMSTKYEDREEIDQEYSYFPEQLEAEEPSVEATEGGAAASELEIFDARVLWWDGPRLVFEFDVPADGFMLPYDGDVVVVYFTDGTTGSAIVRGGESSRQGPHHPGLTIRMSLELEHQSSWPRQEALISWHIAGIGTVNLHVTVE